MFKKIEIWILYLVIFLGLPVAVSFGVLVRQELVGTQKLGKLSKSALFLAEIPMNLKKTFELSQRMDLQLPDRFPALDGFNGSPNSQESYLLLSRYDGNLGEGIIEMVDLTNFEVLHTWNPKINKFNALIDKGDEFKYLDKDDNDSRLILIHPLLHSDGGLFFNSEPIRKIDECSNLIFQNTHDKFHHSIEIDIDGDIWIPSHMYPQTLPVRKVGRETKDEGGFYDDGIVKLSSKGEILYEKSVSQIFIDNGLEYLLFGIGRYFEYDPIHLNDIQPVDFDGLYWKKGDVFLSLRSQSMIILYRPSTNKIIWKGTGPMLQQHDIDILDDHRIAFFNNRSINIANSSLDIVDEQNEVNIYNFKTNKYSSYLKDSLLENQVKTVTQGRSEILPNGDLFLEETDSARTLYFNADGSLRWTHLNRADDGNVYRVGWSRILHTEDDILNVKNFMQSRGKCDF